MTDRYQEVCQPQLTSLNDKLDRLDEAIRGNGKPGILTRIDRLEVSAAARGRFWWLVVGAILTLAMGGAWRLIFRG